jgi:hypothetical protein
MKRALVFASTVALACTLVPALAATPPPVPIGIAWDSVMKFAPSNDAAILQPGTFDADYQTAAQPVQAPPQRGGMFGRITAAMDQAGAAMAIFKTGMAERHYIAGNKERTDYPSTQKATILDCGARTLTSLDLKAKTYTVVSLDAPRAPVSSGPSSGRTAPGAMPTDDGTRIKMTLVNKALGPRTIAPETTDGYSSDMTVVATRPNGDSSTSTMSLVEYLSKYPRTSLVCRSLGSGTAPPPGVAGMGMMQYQMMQSALYGSDPRFTISSSGPALPNKRMALWELMTMTGGQAGQARGGFSMLSERGNVRSVRADDPVFFVPADFTLAS